MHSKRKNKRDSFISAAFARKIILFTVFSLIITSFSGCSLGGGEEEAPSKRVDLKIWRLFDDEEVMKPIIDDYIEDRKDEYDINITYEEKDYDEYVEATTNALAAGEGPDIWMIRNDWMPREIDKLEPMPEGLIPLDEYKNLYPDIVTNATIVDNEIYGIPWSVDTLALYYNHEIFSQVREEAEDAGKIAKTDDILDEPPANWEELVEASKLLTIKNGDNVERAGISLGESGNVAHSIDILSGLMLQNGTQMVSDDLQTATFNLAIKKASGEPYYSGTEALKFYTSFSDPSKDTYCWNDSMPDSVEAFIQGKSAMMIHYSYIQQYMFENAPTFNYSIAPFPQIKDTSTPVDYGSYWIETVTNNSQNPDIAWDFINYVRTKKQDSYLRATKRPSPYKVSEDDIPIVKERTDSSDSTFRFQLNSAESWYKGKYPQKVDDIFYALIRNVSVFDQDPQSANDTAATKTTTWLQTEPY